MAAVLKPSANVFALLESNDPGDTRLADLGAHADDAATLPVNINKKQQPQMSVWKANKLNAEANAAARNKQQQPPAASKAKTTTAGRNSKPQQPAASKAHQVTGTAANAGKNMSIKRPQQQPAAASKAQQAYTAANAAMNKPYQFQKQQQQETQAPANLTQILFGNAYPSARVLIYKHRQEKLNALAKAKEGVAGGAPTDNKNGGQPNGAAVKDAPAPVQEEPAAPAKPVLPPPPPPSMKDSAQFPSLK